MQKQIENIDRFGQRTIKKHTHLFNQVWFRHERDQSQHQGCQNQGPHWNRIDPIHKLILYGDKIIVIVTSFIINCKFYGVNAGVKRHTLMSVIYKA